MITGAIKNQIDRIWDAFWSGGISNPLEVIEQITSLLFLRRLDDLHTLEENKSARLTKPLERRVFPAGKDGIGRGGGRTYEDLRWSRFKHFTPAEMFTVVSEHAFPFLRTGLGKNHGGDESTYAHHMKDARPTIPSPALLANPPFAGSLDYENTANELLQIVKTKKTELLFLALFLRLLKPGGRAAVIVPGGVFKPYAGVSTAILRFTKTNSGGTDTVWFYDVQADGWSLDDKRTPLLPHEKLGTVPDSLRHSRKSGNPVCLTPDEHAKNNLPDVLARWVERSRKACQRPRTAQSFCVLRPRPDNLDGQYLCHWVRSPRFISEMVRRATGASYPAVSDRIVSESRFPLPPLTEQRRIAEILDKGDALQAKRRAALAQLDTLTRSIFLDMFGDPATNPKGFPITKMGDVCDVRDGTHDSPKYVSEGGYPLVTSKNVTRGVVDLPDANYISEADYVQVNKRSKVHRYKVSRTNRGGTQKFVSLGDLRAFPLPLPSNEEQHKFARRVAAVERLKTTRRAFRGEL